MTYRQNTDCFTA